MGVSWLRLDVEGYHLGCPGADGSSVAPLDLVLVENEGEDGGEDIGTWLG